MEIDGLDCPVTEKKKIKWNSMEDLMISMDCANWTEETKWKQYDSDTASVEFNVTELATDPPEAIGESDNVTKSWKGSTSKHKVSDGRGDELKVSDGVKDEFKSTERKVDALQVSDCKEDELKTTCKVWGMRVEVWIRMNKHQNLIQWMLQMTFSRRRM